MPRTVHLSKTEEVDQLLREIGESARELIEAGKTAAVTVSAEDELLSPADAGKRLRMSRQHVRRLMAAGELEGRQMPNSEFWKIPLSAIMEFEERRTAALLTSRAPRSNERHPARGP